jgi:hypothetical protein
MAWFPSCFTMVCGEFIVTKQLGNQAYFFILNGTVVIKDRKSGGTLRAGQTTAYYCAE